MSQDDQTLVETVREKALRALELVDVSVEKLAPYDQARVTTPDEQEPYDALSDRFMRAVETCLKFFRTYEYYMEAENSETVRDLLNHMEKLGLVSDTHKWMEMRDVRNRVVHDYLPDQLKKLYDLIMEDFSVELRTTWRTIANLQLQTDAKRNEETN